MRFLVALSALVVLCAGNSIPLVPGDNSHYVEGESRYIWIPDGNGVPVLVDLHESVDLDSLTSRNGAHNAYWLFTRLNPSSPQIITHGNAGTIASSNFAPNKPLKVVVHGWSSTGNNEDIVSIKDAFLATSDCNVIVVDWSQHSNNVNYILSANAVPSVGQFIGNFVTWLISITGSSWFTVHFVGVSLGAHAVGVAGRTTGSRPSRITGLDPSGPLWGGNVNALRADDGQYVETIHTDSGLLGINLAIGRASFLPNGGAHPQPGCWTNTCSHDRASLLFTSSILSNHFVGRLCASYQEAVNIGCNGLPLNMGNDELYKQGSGIYGLTTGEDWPF